MVCVAGYNWKSYLVRDGEVGQNNSDVNLDVFNNVFGKDML